MSEPSLTTTTRIAEPAATPGITIRDVGFNPPVDPEAVVRIDLSKGIVPRLRRLLTGELEPVAKPPVLRLAPADELKQLRTLYAHLVAQLAILRERTDGETPAQTTPIQAFGDVQRRYAKRLGDSEDLASRSSCDLALLEHLLVRPGGDGLIALTQLRISQLETELRPPVKPTEDHLRLIAAADNAFRKWGKAHNALHKFELENASAALHHEYKTPRAAWGVDFGRVSSRDVQRVADMACNMPENK